MLKKSKREMKRRKRRSRGSGTRRRRRKTSSRGELEQLLGALRTDGLGVTGRNSRGRIEERTVLSASIVRGWGIWPGTASGPRRPKDARGNRGWSLVLLKAGGHRF